MLQVDFIGSWLVEELSSPARAGNGEFRITGEGDSHVRIVGWAALPGADRRPDFVVLARAEGAVDPELVSGLIMKKHVHRGATPRVSRERDHAFFEESVAIPLADAKDLRILAVDLRSKQVYGLTNLGAPEHPS